MSAQDYGELPPREGYALAAWDVGPAVARVVEQVVGLVVGTTTFALLERRRSR